jgi:hypothetical protein
MTDIKHVTFLPLSLSDREKIETLFKEYRQRYQYIYPTRCWIDHVLGESTDIEGAIFIYYEEIQELFGIELCNKSIPLIVLNVLAHSFNGIWCCVKELDSFSYGIKHPLINFCISLKDIEEKLFLPADFEWDEWEDPPSIAEIALESYDTCCKFFSYLNENLLCCK